MADGYEGYFQAPIIGPDWIHGPIWNRYFAAIGRVLDAQNALLRSARKVSMPDGALALGMADALDRQGDDRLLPRGSANPDGSSPEADATYAARLKAAWTTWGQHPTNGGGAGSILGILNQLKIAGFPIEPTPPNYWTTGAFLVNHLGYLYTLQSGELHYTGTAGVCINRQNLAGTVPGDLTGWTLDARDQFYSHFMILFVEDVPTLTNAECPAKSRLNAICKRWKSASSIYSGCAIVPQENSAKCCGWPLTLRVGDVGLHVGTNGARFIAPE
jgi:hypothetical protein